MDFPFEPTNDAQLDAITFDFFGFDFDFSDNNSDDLDFDNSAEQVSKLAGAHSLDEMDSSRATPAIDLAIQESKDDSTSLLNQPVVQQTSDALASASSSSVLGKSTSSHTSKVTLAPNKRRKVTPANNKKKSSKACPNEQLANTKPIPPGPIAMNDTRRTLAKLFLNTFNSCDVQKLRDVLTTHCTEDLVAIHRYEGIKNPYGREVTRVKGQAQILDLWQSLFKSAPDFFFNALETRAFYDPQYRVVIACKFTWGGTRILDVKVAEQLNEEVLRNKLARASDFSTDQKELMESLMKEREALLSSQSTNNVNNEPNNSAVTTQTKSLFHGTGEFSISEGAGAKFFVDQTPLAKKMAMRCKGTFIVYLNEVNRVHKIEFVYISMDEAESNSHAAANVEAAYGGSGL